MQQLARAAALVHGIDEQHAAPARERGAQHRQPLAVLRVAGAEHGLDLITRGHLGERLLGVRARARVKVEVGWR